MINGGKKMSSPLEIFYVEDDVIIAQAVKEYFEQLKYKVAVYSTIEETKKALLNLNYSRNSFFPKN